MSSKHLFAALLLLVAPLVAYGQGNVQGKIVEVRVTGTTTYADIVRTIITARVGTPAASVDLEAERNRIYSLGTFESVTLAFESSPAGPILVITVVENPRVGEIEFEGNATVPSDSLLEALRVTNLLEPGRVYNTTRAEEAKETIRQQYRQAGFPFDVDVELDVTPAPDLATSAADVPVRLTYTVDEAAAVEKVEFEGNTVLTDADLDALFQGLERAGEFDPKLYADTVQAVSTRYWNLGFRGSGVDTSTTSLERGVLTVRVLELKIASIDTTALGVDPGELKIKPGDLFNYDDLLAEVKRLARGRSSDVQLQAAVSPSGGVRVTFRLGAPETAGTVDKIAIEGNTVLSTEAIVKLLELQVGDTFTSVLAQEDFQRIVRAYQAAGYRVVTRPDFSYDDGTYVQRITELRIAGYEVRYEGEPSSTRDTVITRYLPKVGSVVSDKQIVEGLRQVAALGVVDVQNYALEPAEAQDEALVVITAAKRQTGELRPAAQYATDTGFSGSLSYSEKNFLGLAHTVGAEVDVLNTDIGIMLGGRVSYSIPWLYVDALDFQDVPTAINVSLFSVVNNNNPLSAGNQTSILYPGLADLPENRVRVGEYTVRSSGLGFSVGRPIAADTYLLVSANGAYNDYKLEPPVGDCKIEGGKVQNPTNCSVPSTFAAAYLPTSGLSAFTGARVNYDSRSDTNFPADGLSAYGAVGVGFGNDLLAGGVRTGYMYEQVSGGIRAYARLSDLMPAEIQDKSHVFAVRLDVGHQFGGVYPASKRFTVGRTNDVATQIRGYTLEDFDLARTYATTSFEYRYDFGLSTVATQTVIGLAFVDVGWSSSVPGFAEYATPVFAGAGLGVQVNLGFGGLILPAIRMDYAFSEKHPTGVFSFRVGPVF
ncbi:MAG: POTRA domain-containing protein [Trueperaceae bacterium]